MHTLLTLICLQHCLHYAPYNVAATHGSPQDNLIILKCSQFINVPCWGIELLLALATAQFSHDGYVSIFFNNINLALKIRLVEA